MINTVDLTQKAMLISLNIGSWTARKYDDTATKAVADKFAAANDAGRYNKMLIAKEALKAIQQLDNKIRSFHYTNTLPWNDNNQRIILNRGYADYSDAMRKFKEEREKLVYELVQNLPSYIEEARIRLGRLFKIEEYPNPNEIERKFYFDYSVMPIPSSEDFRVSLAMEEVDRIRQDIERRIQQNIKGAMLDLFKRLRDVVSHMAQKLGEKDAIFRNSLVDNVYRLTEILPKLDLVDDPEFDKIRNEIVKKLCAHDADTLRENPMVREKVANAANEVLIEIESAMSAYMG